MSCVAGGPPSRAVLGAAGVITRRIAAMATTDVYPGKDLGTLELTITDEMVHHYIKGLDEPNPWYTTASPFGGPVAPVIVYQQADSEFKTIPSSTKLRSSISPSANSSRATRAFSYMARPAWARATL